MYKTGTLQTSRFLNGSSILAEKNSFPILKLVLRFAKEVRRVEGRKKLREEV